MKKLLIVVLSVIIIGLIGGYVAVNSGQGNDEKQILSVMERGQQSIEKKSASMTKSCISENYSDDFGMNRQKICSTAAQAFTAQCDYEVELSAPQITVNNDQAEAKTHFKLWSVASGDRQQQISTDLVLHFKKETGRRYFIYPVKEWKVIKIDGLNKAIDLAL